MARTHWMLYAIFVIVWIIAAIHPKYPQDWLLENVLVLLLFPLVIWLDRRYHLSTAALGLLLLFGALHELGAHYTYAEMPFFDFITKLFHFSRNHYDRVVHFLFGLLLFRPLFEIFRQIIGDNKITLWFVFLLITSISTFYELLEWAATMLFHPDLGMAFLGTQGDFWDAHKDTLAAICGGTINLILFYRYYLHFDKERT